ncbi:MAG: imidazole glycerol phosphate synthase subunit HisH [Candidatus Eremiobacteraeota bacterium]|nr:imidazole glycerol phosphate synthase subunit HisH [Candidatus Eremiobacteraeota bacterium]MBV8354990.1 imidazole glycerol phosphate synthase subunit HisH [Candidatus Eremiobacteraeota bacterium]
MIAVLDYGGGNLGSLLSALRRRHVDFEATADPARLDRASAAILPGDGAFAATMQALRARGLHAALRSFITSGRPFLGICIGMQILYERSLEHGEHEGLAIFPGTIARLASAPRVPHMGWNQLSLERAHPLIAGIDEGDFVYFLHSYAAPVDGDTVAACTYGERFAAIVARDNVVATQFHPEKSQRVGGRILENFLHRVA